MRIPTAAKFCLLILSLPVLHPMTSHADALADFSGGIGDSSANQFRGSSGQGWIDSWQTFFSQKYEGAFSFEIEKDPAFGEGVDVLHVARNEDDGFARISRTLDPSETLLDAPQEVSFQIRFDQFSGAEGGEESFRFSLGAFSAENEKNQSPASSVWCLVVAEKTQTWAIYHRNDTGELTLLNTQISLEMETVYTVKVHLLPVEHSFRITLESNSQFYESPSLFSMSTEGAAEVLSFTGWTANNGPGNFRWSLGPVSVRNPEAK